MWTASESPIQLLYWLCLNRVRCTSCQSLRRSFYFDPALFNEHVNTTDFMQDHVRNIAALVYKNNHHTIFSQPLTRLGSLWWVVVFYTVSRKPRDRTMNCHSPTSFQISVLETYFDLPAVICGYLDNSRRNLFKHDAVIESTLPHSMPTTKTISTRPLERCSILKE